ncbi:MAG: FMN-dependent oxidoreductase (nitrilotriacetate monooxygenase family) [Gammaproteobacteria bacterium]|jgi:FMN-dependent oxidoreductase (nitrilotriacetate monooxygenase family)
MKQPRRMLLNAFSMNCISHIQQGLWTRPETRQLEYASLDPWVELAKILEKGCFDAIFLADVVGTYDVFRGDARTSIAEAMQIPINDPAMLISAMAHATEHLGFAYTSSVLQSPPFTFARQASTLDHLTKGRVGWNVVTSYLRNAGSNLGFGGLPGHDERYARADEYLDVVYKLWEGSWEDDAVLRDTVRGIHADPDKIHAINHQGKYYDVEGPHLCEPSPQRTPLLFQAGSSTRGRTFAAQHAECVFIVESLAALNGPASVIRDIREQATKLGRRPDDIRFFQGLSPVVGATEAQARAKADEYIEGLSMDGALAHISGSIGVDLSDVSLDAPLSSMKSGAMRGWIKGIVEAEPDKTKTFRDLVRARTIERFLIGTPEQIADELERWFAAGVDGFNLTYCVTPGTFVDFIDGVVPVLQQRGLVQREYAPGTLREKMFGQARVHDSHPAAAYRR